MGVYENKKRIRYLAQLTIRRRRKVDGEAPASQFHCQQQQQQQRHPNYLISPHRTTQSVLSYVRHFISVHSIPFHLHRSRDSRFCFCFSSFVFFCPSVVVVLFVVQSIFRSLRRSSFVVRRSSFVVRRPSSVLRNYYFFARSEIISTPLHSTPLTVCSNHNQNKYKIRFESSSKKQNTPP